VSAPPPARRDNRSRSRCGGADFYIPFPRRSQASIQSRTRPDLARFVPPDTATMLGIDEASRATQRLICGTASSRSCGHGVGRACRANAGTAGISTLDGASMKDFRHSALHCARARRRRDQPQHRHETSWSAAGDRTRQAAGDPRLPDRARGRSSRWRMKESRHRRQALREDQGRANVVGNARQAGGTTR